MNLIQYCAVLGLISGFFSCGERHPISETGKKAEGRTFYNPEQKLYFNNVRSLFYSKETNDKAQIDFWILDKNNFSDSIPIIRLKIADAWTREEVYLSLEPNAFFVNKDTFEITWVDYENDMKGKFNYIQRGPINDFDFARDIYNSISNNIGLFYKNIPLFDEESKEAFRITFKDYSKWISK